MAFHDKGGVILREKVPIVVGALASDTAVKSTGGVALQTTSFRILKTKLFITQTAGWGGEGAEVYIGIANGALSVSEIAVAIALGGPDDRNDPNKEIANRAVWLIADIKEPEAGTFSQPVNGGMPIEFNLRWTFTPTEGWDWFAFNPMSATLVTGAIFELTAQHFGMWVD